MAESRRMAGRGRSVSGDGSSVWQQPEAIAGEGYSTAQLSEFTGDIETQWLVSDRFSHDVPANGVITGVLVRVRRYQSTVVDAVNGVRLFAAGLPQGESRARDSEQWESYVDAEYGGDGDLWGVALTPEIVNSPEFGVGIRAALDQSMGVAMVEAVEQVVYYTE